MRIWREMFFLWFRALKVFFFGAVGSSVCAGGGNVGEVLIDFLLA